MCRQTVPDDAARIQAGASPKGRDFAARWSDVIFCSHASFDSARDFYQDIKSRAVRHGRRPEDIKILPMATPVIGTTTRAAHEVNRELADLVPPLAGLSTLSYHLDIDLSGLPLDEPLPDVDAPGVQGHYKEVVEMTRREGLTLRQLGKRYGGRTEGTFVGTAAEVADGMERWFAEGACHGFTVGAAHTPERSRTSSAKWCPNYSVGESSARSTRARPCATTWAADTLGRLLVTARGDHFVSDARTGPAEAVQAGELLLASFASCSLSNIQLHAQERASGLTRGQARVSYERDLHDPTRYKWIRLDLRLTGVPHEEAETLVRPRFRPQSVRA
ncbi:LLM class flavin-dependent oxidoreductase [Streptomyces scopuliridis]|uniref:LLM class flavin-dependent oxidoreductase n=1 Tax=Streptomyces scopuliridis TaxID=452529 RepID=UPI00368FA5C6